ncbi:hypothetical protein DNTS_030159 [Danionella cerebrum]|uniref:Arginine vasopressin-induced protein 1 n=1 Tax=Danionella cerebrum TaxID=2873325 RepID=A0A553Q7Z8_9TELE|nr:hypothetical protein DNTS_030159 [Danionella translucida]
MEDVASPPVLPGPSQPSFSRRNRKSGTANIFQGVNLRQLRRLFQAAGDPDADQRARMVWCNRRVEDGAEKDKDEEDGGMSEVETGLAQALVGLRLRARTRSGFKVDTHKEGTRWVRAFGHLRINGSSAAQTSDLCSAEDEEKPDSEHSSAPEASGDQSNSEAGSCDQGDPVSPQEENRGFSSSSKWSWNSTQEKDPERYLHRIRH